MHKTVKAALQIAEAAEPANDQPTHSELLDIAAKEMFELSIEIDRLTALLNERKQAAITLFGEGTTHVLKDFGKVQVLGATQDRPSGKIEPKFDLTSFLNAAPALKAQLEKTGIVKVVEGVTRGIKAQVRLVKETA